MNKLTLFWILIFSFQIFSQERAVALKFDEFTRNKEKQYWKIDISETSRIKRFALELKKNPQMKGAVIKYDSRKQLYNVDERKNNDNDLGVFDWELEQNGVSENRVIKIFGGIRENESYEFWLLPKDAQIPKPMPHFQNSQIVYCPQIETYWKRNNLKNSPVEFSSEIKKLLPSTSISYKWIVSNGKIISGETDKKMLLDLNSVSESKVAVKLVIEGINPECKNDFLSIVPIIAFPYKWDEFDNSYNENIKMRLHYLAEELKESPNLEVKLFYYPSRFDPLKSQARTIKDLNKGMTFSGFSPEKITIEFGGYRDEVMFELWVYPKGMESPKPTPTVDAKFVKFPAKNKRN